MKALIVLIAFIPLAGFSKTAEGYDRAIPYSVKYKADASVKAGQGKVTIVCEQFKDDGLTEHTIRYGMNGSSKTKKLTSGKTQFSFSAKPAKYVFQFYYTSEFEEIQTSSIQVKPGMATVIYLRFDLSHYPEVVKKPVIYLYPEVQTDVRVVVQPTGKMSFTYPEYINGWNVTAQPNGDLTVDGKSFPYLFWEAEQALFDPFDQSGFIVKQENIVAFLEEKLTTLGLNTVEQTDFITFWGPQFAAHDQCKVKFVINEQCDVFADLTISPTPDHVNRVYIVWSPAESNDQLTEQQLPVLNRDGFDVLEWGGVEIPAHVQFHASTH